MHGARCIGLPLRSATRPLQACIQKSTDALRLPRFRNALHVDAHTHSRFLTQGHKLPRFDLPAQRRSMRTLHHACHAKRTLLATSNYTMSHTCPAKRTMRTRKTACSRHPELHRPTPPSEHAANTLRTLANVRHTRGKNGSNTVPPPDPHLKARSLRSARGKKH